MGAEMMHLAVITTHPIQYYAPLFRLLGERGKIRIKVFYTWEKDAADFDVDFGRTIQWDIGLLDGYECQFVSNQGSLKRTFWGVKNPGLIKAIEDWKADAVLVFGWNYRSHLRVLRHFKNKLPVLFRGDSTLLDERPGWKKIVRRKFLRWVYSHVDMALYVGINNKRYFLAHGLEDRQLVFAPHAIDNDRFMDAGVTAEPEADEWRAALGIGVREIVFIFVGKFQEKKDPVLLIRAFEQLKEKAHLLLVGNGGLERELKELAASNPRIHFLPFQNQSRMPIVYRLGDIFCLPSRGPGETWGLAVNEAMACGRPVLVSDRCGCAADLVKEGENGFIFLSGDLADLSDKMSSLLRAADLKSKGKASAGIIHSWSYDQVVSVIEKMMLSEYA
jgi:glycosyltransferase involved in cell wall biosynthesis